MNSLLALTLASLLSTTSPTVPETPDTVLPTPIVTLRGITTRVTLHHVGCAIRARPFDQSRSPLTVSVSPGAAPGEWTLSVVGMMVGIFDASELIECADGMPASLPATPIRVVSALPAGLHINLAEGNHLPLSLPPRRTLPLIPAVALWALAPVAWWLLRVRARIRHGSEAPPRTPRDPHLALIDAIGVRPLTVSEQGRLELLTLRALARRSGAGDDVPAADLHRTLRRDAASSEILDALELWLHRPGAHTEDAHRLRRLLIEKFASEPASSGATS